MNKRQEDLVDLAHELSAAERGSLKKKPFYYFVLDESFAQRFSPIVADVLRHEIVVERSPPTLETLGHVLQHASSISLGVLLGTHLDQDPLMIVKVSGAIIAMGAVIGVTRGLEKGLSELITSVIKGIRQRKSKRKKKKVAKSRR